MQLSRKVEKMIERQVCGSGVSSEFCTFGSTNRINILGRK